MKKQILTFILLFFQVSFGFAQNTSVLTQHGDNRRTGWNPSERILTTSNVKASTFGKSYAMPVDAQIFAQPLVAGNVSVGGAKHNLVLVATVNNTVYAFDADKAGTFWSRNYTVPGMRTPNNKDMYGACGGNYFDFNGNIGIVGTPVIDSLTSTMYFVARSTNTPAGSAGTGSFYQYLHAIDISSGNERPNSPVLISASSNGSGDGNVNGVISFDPQRQNQRAGLLLLNGMVYISWASHCDWGPYHGWILGYDENSLQQKIVFNDTPDGGDGGIWMSGAGISADENGNLFVSVGNGTVGTTGSNPRNFGESALKLTPSGSTLAVTSFFTPSNFQDLDNADLDLGSTQMMLIPNSSTAVTGCKDGNIYILNKDNLGGYNPAGNNVLEAINIGSGKTLRTAFSYFRGSSKEWLYSWSENAALKAFPFIRSNGTFDQTNVVISSAQGPVGGNGALLSVSSNGSRDGTGILWATHAASGDALHSVVPGILHAFDANDVTKELWNSNMNPKDNIGNYAKFVCPTIANGKVYMATFSNQLLVYGVTDTTKIVTVCKGTGGDLAKGKPAVASSLENSTFPASNAVDSVLTSRWSSQASDPQSLYVDLGTRYSICGVTLNWEAALGRDFQIQLSDDAVNWTTVSSISGNTLFSNALSVTGTGRFVRMYGTARGTPYGYSLYEFQVYGSPAGSCAVPSGLAVSAISPTAATLSWAPVPGVNNYNVRYKSVSGLGYTSLSAATNSLTLTSLSCGTDYIFDVQANCSATQASTPTADKAFSTLVCNNSACGFLPTRWNSQDIGRVGLSGASCFNNGKFRLQASGTDIWNNADGFQYAFKTFLGDGSVTVRIDSLNGANPWAKAGIMFRETLDSTSRQALIAMTPTAANGVAFQFRQTAGGPSTNINLPGIQLPYYVKMVKRGTKYAGYISADSLTWKQVGTTVDLGFGATSIYAGLVLSSHDNVHLASAVFSHVPIIFTADTTVSSGSCPAGNLALNRPGASSSTLSGDKSIYVFKAFDGDTSTHWLSQVGIDSQWIYVDLGKRYQLCQAKILWGAQLAKNYQLQVSDDAVTWTTINTVSGNTALYNSVPLNGAGRFLRVFATARGTTGGYSLAEFQVSGAALPGQPVNIALNKTSVSSSNENGILVPSAAVDGLGATRWGSLFSDPSWIYVDLGSTFNLSQVVLDWEVALGQDFQIQASADAVNWTTIKSVTGNTQFTNVLPVTGSARYVRMFGTKRGTGYGYSLYEFEVDGSPAPMMLTALKPKIRVYPVPAVNVVSLETEQEVVGEVIINDLITNRAYKPVYISKTPKKSVLNISEFKTGLYVIRMYTSRGKISTIISIQK